MLFWIFYVSALVWGFYRINKDKRESLQDYEEELKKEEIRIMRKWDKLKYHPNMIKLEYTRNR